MEFPLTLTVPWYFWQDRSDVYYDDGSMGTEIKRSSDDKTAQIKFDNQEQFDKFVGEVEWYASPGNYEGSDFTHNKKLILSARSTLNTLKKANQKHLWYRNI